MLKRETGKKLLTGRSVRKEWVVHSWILRRLWNFTRSAAAQQPSDNTDFRFRKQMNKTVQIRVDEGQLISLLSNYLQVVCEKNVLIHRLQ